MKISKTFVGIATMAVFGAAHAQDFTNQAAFVAALNSDYYLEQFSDFSNGSPLDGTTTDWDAPGNGTFGWHAYAAEGLWSNNQALSTNYAYDTLEFTFANSPTPIYAFGGNFQETDIDGNTLAGQVTLNFSDGHSTVLTNQTSSSFYGYISTTPFSEVDVVSDNAATLDWVQVSDLYTGDPAAPTPEPMTLACLGCGVAALIRRRRRRA